MPVRPALLPAASAGFGRRWNALGGIFDKPTILGSAAGLQGVGEAGAEAILPLDTLWTEMSARLRAGMVDVLSGFMGERSTENTESLLRDLIDAVRANNGETETVPAVNVENMVMAKFTLYGSGTITLITYSGAVVLSGIGNGIVLDWEAQECTSLDGGTLLNDKVDGDP